MVYQPAGQDHLASSGAYVGAVEEMMCAVYVSVTKLGKGTTSEAEKYLFRAASVWWRCVQDFVSDSGD